MHLCGVTLAAAVTAIMVSPLRSGWNQFNVNCIRNNLYINTVNTIADDLKRRADACTTHKKSLREHGVSGKVLNMIELGIQEDRNIANQLSTLLDKEKRCDFRLSSRVSYYLNGGFPNDEHVNNIEGLTKFSLLRQREWEEVYDTLRDADVRLPYDLMEKTEDMSGYFPTILINHQLKDEDHRFGYY